MKPELIQKRRELQQQRESVNDQLTALSDTLESENRGMSEEEQGEFAKLRKQADEVDQRLELIYAQIGVDRRAGDDATPTTDIGMTAKELHQFSFLKLVRALSEPNNAEAQRAAGLELEASKAADDLARRNGELVRGARMPQSDTFVVDRREDGSTQLRSVRSLLDERAKRAVIPADVAKRVLTAGDAGQGAELVADTLRPQDFIDVLRARTVLGSLGATMLPGLVGDQQIPKKTSASAGVWLTPEDQEIPAESMPVFGQVTMTPKTIGVYTEISRQLTLQATPAIEGLVRQDQADGIAVALDNAGIYGTGLNGQPEGIANTTGINNPTDFAGAIPTSAGAGVDVGRGAERQRAVRWCKGVPVQPDRRGAAVDSAERSGDGGRQRAAAVQQDGQRGRHDARLPCADQLAVRARRCVFRPVVGFADGFLRGARRPGRPVQQLDAGPHSHCDLPVVRHRRASRGELRVQQRRRLIGRW
jgi:HK97 family phage major capsid protein